MKLVFLKKAVMLLSLCFAFSQCNCIEEVCPESDDANGCNLSNTIEYKDYIGVFSEHYNKVVFINPSMDFEYPSGEYHLPTPFDNDKMIQVCNFDEIFKNKLPDYSNRYIITVKVQPRGEVSMQPFPLPALAGEITKISLMYDNSFAMSASN